MTLNKQRTGRKQERGIAMVMALLALMILAVIGMGFLYMSTTENSANRNYKDQQKTYFASRGGLETVRALLGQNANFRNQANNLIMPAAVPLPGTTGIIYVYNSDGVTKIDASGAANANTADTELCQERYAGLALAVPAGTAGVPVACIDTTTATPIVPLGASFQTAFVPAGAPAGAVPNIPLRNNGAAVTSTTVPGSDIPNTNTTSALPFQWVRITNKQNLMGLTGQLEFAGAKGQQICWDGVQELPLNGANCPGTPTANNSFPTPVWLLTSLATTPNGSRRMTQMEVAFTPPIKTNAAIATSGSIKLTGKVTVNGNDSCGKLPPLLSVYSGECVPGQGACTCTSSSCPTGTNVNAITNLVPPSQLTGLGPSGVTTYNSSGAVTSQGSTQQGAWPYNVDQLINTYKQSATPATQSPWNYTAGCSGTNCKVANENFGTFPTDPTSPATGSPEMVYVPGDLHLSSPQATGDGILIVDGDLTVNGGLTYYGLILVKGQIHFTGGGGAAVNVDGAVLAGDNASAADTVGGSFKFQFSSCALNQNSIPGPPHLIATHELMF